MASINPNNVCNFTGRLGNDPEVRILPNEKKIVSFSIAVDRRWKEENGEKKSKTNWIRCVAFHPISKLVEACHVKKGNLVHIVGQIENESYIDANTNQRRDTYSIWINGFEKLTGDKKNNAENTTANQHQANASTEEYNEEEDLPF